MADLTQDTNNTPELQSPFEQLKKVDADECDLGYAKAYSRILVGVSESGVS